MRITPQSDDTYSLFSRFMFWLQRRKSGTVLDATRLWGRSSWLYLTFSLFYAAISRKSSPIEPALISLLNTRVAQINVCPFCIDLNASFLEKQGVSLEKIAALPEFASHPLYSASERAALAYAEAMTDTTKRVDDFIFSELKKYFSDDQIIELTAIIAFENLSAKFNAALAVPSQGFCQLSNKSDN
jgi:AhpD family alkylhydroperoxidase